MNNDFLKGYRTYLVAAVLFLYGVCQLFGVDIPAIPQPGDGGTLDTLAVLFALLRKITSTPAAPLLPKKGA